MRASRNETWRQAKGLVQVKFAFLRAFIKSRWIRVFKQKPWEVSSFDPHEILVVNAKLDTVSGYAFDIKGHFIPQSSSWPMPEAYLRWPVRPIFTINHRTDEIMCFLGSSSYYHWLLEDLPAYLRAKVKYPNSQSVHPKLPFRYVRDALELTGEVSQEIRVYVELPKLALAPKSRALFPSRQDVNALEQFQSRARIQPDTVKKIYVSRRDSGRYPENESEIEQFVRAKGFEVVSLTGLSLAKQISLFSGAEVIIGTHGAGLANIVWSMSGRTRVVEICLPNQPDCFARLASLKGIELNRVLPLGSGSSWKVDLDLLGRTGMV